MVLIQRLDKNNLLLTEKATISSLMKECGNYFIEQFQYKDSRYKDHHSKSPAITSEYENGDNCSTMVLLTICHSGIRKGGITILMKCR